MTVDCNSGEADPREVPRTTGSPLDVSITIPSGLPESMFPLEFKIEAEAMTLTPETSRTNSDLNGYNIPVHSGTSISPNLAGKTTFHFIRTLTRAEYNSLPENEGKRTFHAYFKSNRRESATTIWVDNEYFHPASVEFTNPTEPRNHFYIKASNDEVCFVGLKDGMNKDKVEIKYGDEGDWVNYPANNEIRIDPGKKVYFRAKNNNKVYSWRPSGDDGIFHCYRNQSDANTISVKDGKFSIGGNIASLIVGDSYETEQGMVTAGSGDFNFANLFKKHINLTDASDLTLPMLTLKKECYKSMFEGCTSLVRAPALPATTLAEQCYRRMFTGCSSLLEAPALPATSFNGKGNCYQMIFNGCTLISEIRMNSAVYSESNFISNNNFDPGQAIPDKFWLGNVAATGTIYLNPAIKNSSGWNQSKVVPEGWTVLDWE